MKKVVLVNGIIAGLIVSAIMVISFMYYQKTGQFNNGMLIGYASMVLAFSFIFVGVKSFRDRYNNGTISFGKAFRIGLWITLICATFYVATWLIEYYFFFPNFVEVYMADAISKARALGATEAELAKQTAEMSSMGEWYKNPFVNALITYMEIVPVGLIVSVISALLLKKK